MRVSLADLSKQYFEMQDEVDTAVHEVLSSGRFILGPIVEKLDLEDIRN